MNSPESSSLTRVGICRDDMGNMVWIPAPPHLATRHIWQILLTHSNRTEGWPQRGTVYSLSAHSLSAETGQSWVAHHREFKWKRPPETHFYIGEVPSWFPRIYTCAREVLFHPWWVLPCLPVICKGWKRWECAVVCCVECQLSVLLRVSSDQCSESVHIASGRVLQRQE